MMKNIFTIAILLILSNFIFGQSIFDIEIDEIYIDGDNIAFINNGELNSYKCELTPIMKKDFHCEIELACEEDNEWMRSKNPIKIEFIQFLKFKNTGQFINYIKDNKFEKVSNTPEPDLLFIKRKPDGTLDYNDAIFIDNKYHIETKFTGAQNEIVNAVGNSATGNEALVKFVAGDPTLGLKSVPINQIIKIKQVRVFSIDDFLNLLVVPY